MLGVVSKLNTTLLCGCILFRLSWHQITFDFKTSALVILIRCTLGSNYASKPGRKHCFKAIMTFNNYSKFMYIHYKVITVYNKS